MDDSGWVSSLSRSWRNVWDKSDLMWVYQQVVCWKRCNKLRCLYEELFFEQNGNQSQCVLFKAWNTGLWAKEIAKTLLHHNVSEDLNGTRRS